MIPPLSSHKRYVRSALAYSHRHGGLRTDHRHYHVWQKLKETNLGHAYPFLAILYSDTQGRLGRDPLSMFCSCLAMMLCGVTSFTVWVGMMRDDPFHALISGFHPDDTPGVGTYDFQDRLLQRPPQPRTTTRRPYRSREQRDKAKQHKDKNDLRPHNDIVNRLADRILARPFPNIPLVATLEGCSDFSALPAYERTLHCLFFTSFVTRSVELNLIDLDTLHVAVNCPSSFPWPTATAMTASTASRLSIAPVKPSASACKPLPSMRPTMRWASFAWLLSADIWPSSYPSTSATRTTCATPVPCGSKKASPSARLACP